MSIMHIGNVVRAPQQKPLGPTPDGIVLLGVPMPPSANNLFTNSRYAKRRVKAPRYQAWIKAAGWTLRSQLARRVPGKVSLTYFIGENGTRADLGNLEKALTDLLVELHVIDGDGPKIVREINLRWKDGEDVTVKVVPA